MSPHEEVDGSSGRSVEEATSLLNDESPCMHNGSEPTSVDDTPEPASGTRQSLNGQSSGRRRLRVRIPEMKSSSWAALKVGFANLWQWASYYCSVFILESALHSVNSRRPDDFGEHDGYYGLAVISIFFMAGNLIAPSFSYFLRAKWILTSTAITFVTFFLTFQLLNRYLFFAGCVFMGTSFAVWNVGYNTYLLQISTRRTLEHNQALSWMVISMSTFVSGILYLIVTALGEADSGSSSYRNFSDGEIRIFYLAFTCCAAVALALFCFLPTSEVDNSIASNQDMNMPLASSLTKVFWTIIHPRTLLLVPFYCQTGMFLSFWLNVFPTTIHFTKSLSHHIFLPAYFGMVFTAGSVTMSCVTIALSKRRDNFGLRPMMCINVAAQSAAFLLIVLSVPQWSTIRQNDDESLLIKPTIITSLIIAYLFGIADAAANTARTVMTSLIIPESKQQSVSVSRLFHGTASSACLFAASSLSVYTYIGLMGVFMIAAFISHWIASGIAMKVHKKESVFVVAPLPVLSGSNGKIYVNKNEIIEN